MDERIHKCKLCSYTDDRDVAAAKVMLSWALGTNVLNRGEGSSTSNPAKRKHCGGMKQLASLKRLKRLLVNTEIGNSDLSVNGSE